MVGCSMPNFVTYWENRYREGIGAHYEDPAQNRCIHAVRERALVKGFEKFGQHMFCWQDGAPWPDESLLDYGCGSGEWFSLWRLVSNGPIYGWDRSQEARHLAKMSADRYAVRLQLQLAHVVVLVTVFQHLLAEYRDPHVVLLRLRDLVKPHGWLVLLDNFPYIVPVYQQYLDHKRVLEYDSLLYEAEQVGFYHAGTIPVSWVDTTLFHYIPFPRLVGPVTNVLERLISFVPQRVVKYRLVVFRMAEIP